MPTRKPTRRILLVAAALVIVFGASGCLVGKTENTKYSGRYIGEETLKQIEAGDSQDEVASLLAAFHRVASPPFADAVLPSNRTAFSQGEPLLL